MIIICGDTHGGWDTLFRKIDHNNLKDFTLIHVGDIGIGFKANRDKEMRGLEHENARLLKRGIQFIGIRGNHDDPAYFDGSVKLSNLELIQDYSLRQLEGEGFLFVGGAISIDRVHRKQDVSWWVDEKFILDESRCVKADVVITHSAPPWNGPLDKTPFTDDHALFQECKEERLQIGRLLELSKPRAHYCGHFHMYLRADHLGCRSVILDEFELVQHS